MNSFSIPRFGRLMQKHTAEHFRTYMLWMAVLAGALITFILFYIIPRGEPFTVEAQMDLFGIGYLAAGSVFTSTVFADLGSPTGAIAALTLPASQPEKFLVRWIYSYIIYQVVYIAIFYAVLIPIQNIVQYPGKASYMLNIFEEPRTSWYLLVYSILHATALFGAIFFGKLHFVKSAVIVFIFLLVTITIHNHILERVFELPDMSALPFDDIRFIEKNNVLTVAPGNGSGNYLTLCEISCALLLWAASYFRFREKQV